MDGWCLGIVIQELFQIYHSLKVNTAVTLKEVYPYSGYIKWLEKQDKQEAVSYWKGYLENYEMQASLPRFGGIDDEAGYVPEQLEFRINETMVKGLSDIARDNNATLSTMVQTIWGILLQKYNNADDVVFGSVVSGRHAEISGIQTMVGLFINTIPVRIRCDGTMPFLELIKKAQDRMLLSEKYNYLSLAELQTNTMLKQHLLDNIVAFENYPIQAAVENSGTRQAQGFSINGIEVWERTN